MIEQLISRVFYARNVAHFQHWTAKGKGSYARHMALGSFYDDIIGALDTLVEAHQAVNGLIGSIPAPDTSHSDVLPLLKADVDWIEENHGPISMGSRAIDNLIDSVTEVYLSAIYKLENLE